MRLPVVARSHLKRLAIQVVPPCCAFILARAVVLLAATNAGVQPFTAAPYFKSDAGLYLSIAREGYDLAPCSALPYRPGQWCGNTGWVPGYPWLVRGLAGLSSTPEKWAIVLPALFYLATVVLLWVGFLKAELHPKSLATLGLLALFPGQIYYQAGFPISQFLFFAMVALLLLAQGRLWSAAAAGAVAALTYSTGFILACVFGLWTLLALPRRRWLAGMLAASLVFSGFVTVLVVDELTVGRWNAFFLVQEKYGHALGSPVRALRVRTADFFDRAKWQSRRVQDSITLKAANGRLLTAEAGGGGAVLANREAAGPWETFDVVPQNDGTVALRASGGQFVSVPPTATQVTASARLAGAREKLRLVPKEGRLVAVQGPDGTYLSLGADEGLIAASSRRISGSQLFEMTQVENAAAGDIVAAGNSLLAFGLVALSALFFVFSLSSAAPPAAAVQRVPLTEIASRPSDLSWASRFLGFRRSLMEQPDQRLELLVLIYGLAFYVIPLVLGANVTARRAESLLLPITLLLRRAPLVAQLAAIAVSGYFAVSIARVFFVVGD
jgi:hypothetical protein